MRLEGVDRFDAQLNVIARIEPWAATCQIMHESGVVGLKSNGIAVR
jgi:hypothetical protein